MVSYFEQIERQIESTVAIRGAPLEIGKDHPLKAKGYFPILSPTCVCFTDPCPCDDDEEIIVWLPESAISAQKATDKKTSNGETLKEYRVRNDADLIIETFAKRKASALSRKSHAAPPNIKFSGTRLGLPGGVGAPKPIAGHSVVCAGNTLYYVIEGPDGSGGTLFEYIAIGSCETLSS